MREPRTFCVGDPPAQPCPTSTGALEAEGNGRAFPGLNGKGDVGSDSDSIGTKTCETRPLKVVTITFIPARGL